MSKYRKLVQRRKGPATVAAIIATLAVTFAAMRWTESALATSGANPYAVTAVTDTNPDPTIVETTIVAAGTTEDIGNGVMANLLTFNGTLPGPEFRLNVGDTVIVHYQNNLGHASGIHWHGIELANASDGTPLTQNMVPPGGTFLYKFKVPRPGIYWYHPHHHSSTNQVFKGLYGSIIVTDPNEAALQTSGALPSAAQTLTMVLSDLTVCKAVGSNDAATYDPTLPHVSGGALPAQFGPTPQTLCELTPIDEDGNPRGPYAAGDVPNIQIPGSSGAVNEGQTVVTNGQNVGGRGGTPSAPGALAAGASTYPVNAGQGVRLQLISSTTVRFFRLRLTDNSGTQVPLVRVGGQGGLLDNARVEGGVDGGGFDFQYDSGEILVDPGDRADVVVAIPAGALVGDVLTLWTQDFARTGGGFTNTPTVPVAHFEVTGGPGAVFTIADGTPLRAATGFTVEVLGAPTGTLLDPATFAPVKTGLSSQDIRLTNVPGTSLGINGVQGVHDAAEPYSGAAHVGSTRYAKLGDVLELTVTNVTGAHHPFHLHGFSIQPVSLTGPAAELYTFPYAEFKDNVDVPGNSTLMFRVRLDDRALMDGATLGGGLGRWVFHCHIFFHASFGMISEFDVVAPDGNERPYINANQTIVQGFTGDLFTVQGTYADPDGNPVTLSASSGAIIDNGGGTWTWTETGPTSGLVYVSATDSTGLKDQVAFEVSVAAPPVQVTTTKTVSAGMFSPGSPITYTVVLNNAGASAQSDNPGNEFTDVLPPELTLVSANATSGTALSTIATNTVTWNGSIAAGGSVTITINATIAPATALAMTVTNQGTASFDHDNNGTNETSVLTDDPGVAGAANPTSFNVSSPATLTASKTVTGTFHPGGAITYTVVLTNPGAAAQFDNPGSEFTDVLPAGLTLVSANATSGTALATIATNTVTWNGSVAAGASATITINATIPTLTAPATTITNQGTVSFDGDGNGINEASALSDDPGVAGASNPTSFNVSSPATLTASKTVTGTFHPGGAITYTVVLTNTGAAAQFDNAGNEFTDVLPAGLTLVNANATSGTALATIATNTVTWNGTVAPSASATITINATIPASTAPATTITNQGTVSFDADGNGTNEASALTDDPGVAGASNPTSLIVSSPATLAATKTVAGTFRPSGAITYTVVLTNTGAAAQFDNPGNEFTDVLPAGVTLVSANATSGTALATIATNTVTWNGTVAASASATITINATIPALTAPATTITNQGTVSFDADGNGTNEASALTDDPGVAGASNPTSLIVSSPATLAATKTVAGTFRPSGAITYTVVLTNTGAAAQFDNPGNEFTDVLPAGVTLVSANATSGTALATIATNTVTWNGSLAAGASATITINATIPALTAPATTITNQGTVSFDADGNGTNEASALTDDPGVAGASNPTSLIVSSPATLAATKTVAGTFRPSGAITYTVVLTNAGAAAQFDNPGNEFTDVLPAGVTLVSANATSGTALATIATNTVTWNGSLAAGASATITINATIPALTAPATTITNQGTVSFDADGNGTNEASALTDDPGVAGAGNPTSFTVSSPATVAAAKTVTGTFNPGGAITYAVVLANAGAAPQFDNPGSEFTDVLPASLTLVSATATSGAAVATAATRTVTWNGGVAGGSSVTITINATIPPATVPGTVITNQGTVSFDADGNGTNEGSALTDDPAVPGAANPTSFTTNTAPTITPLVNATIPVSTSHTVLFNIGDDTTAPAALAVLASSSNPALVPASGLTLSGAGAIRTLTITPLANQTGQTVITVSVSDGALTTIASMVLSVDAAAPPEANQAPTIAGLAPATIEENATATLNLTIGDDVTPADALVVSATSSNTELLPASAVVLGGSGSTRTLSLTPNEDRVGQTTITVSVSDGTLTTTVPVAVTVAPAPAPQPPALLTATVTGATVSFNWTRPAAGAVPTFYLLEGGPEPGLSTLPVINTQSRATAWTLALPSGTYFFRVRSGNRAGTSAVSNEVVVRVTTVPGLPGPPIGLVAEVVDTQVTLSWRPPVFGGTPDQWQLEVASIAGGSVVSTFVLPATQFSVTGALAPGDYAARVRGVNGSGQGPASNEAGFRIGGATGCTFPDRPLLQTAGVTGHTVTLSWRGPRNAAADSYRLLVGSVPGGADLGIFDVGPVTSFVADAGNGTYYVTLLATNGCGTSGPSNSIAVVVGGTPAGPAAPTDVRANVDGHRVTIQWSPVGGGISYLVEAGSAPGASNLVVQPVAGTSLVADGVPSGTYYLRVRAVGAGGAGAPSIDVIVVVP